MGMLEHECVVLGSPVNLLGFGAVSRDVTDQEWAIRCGTTQSGNLLSSSRALDGLMGLGQAQISVPTQLATQRKVGQIFAHCLQGNDQGGGTFVIGTILEPNISYTPLIAGQ